MSSFLAQDWTPLFQALIALLATILTVGGSIVLRRLEAKYQTDIDKSATLQYGDALTKSLILAGMKVLPMIQEKGYQSPEVQSAIIRGALGAIGVNFPDAIAGIGITGDILSPANAAKVVSGLTRALPDAMAKLAASPATPDIPNAVVLQSVSASEPTKP